MLIWKWTEITCVESVSSESWRSDNIQENQNSPALRRQWKLSVIPVST